MRDLHADIAGNGKRVCRFDPTKDSLLSHQDNLHPSRVINFHKKARIDKIRHTRMGSKRFSDDGGPVTEDRRRVVYVLNTVVRQILPEHCVRTFHAVKSPSLTKYTTESPV